MCMEGLKNLGSGMRSGYSETPMQPEVNVPAGEHDVPVRRHAGPTKMQHLGNLLGMLARGAADAVPGGTLAEGFELAGRMPLERRLMRDNLARRRAQDVEAKARARRSQIEFEQSQKPRPTGQPFDVSRGGKRVLVQQMSDGSMREVEGYEPAGKTQLPDFIQSGPFAGHMLDPETGKLKAATTDMPLTVPDTSGL